MKHFDENNPLSSDAWDDKNAQLFEHLTPPFQKDKAAIWEELSQTLATPKPKTKIRSLLLNKWVAAASILIVSSLLFCKNYTTTIHVPLGERLAYTLPDGSSVQLNAGSTLDYAPYWWVFDRRLELKGEAFFDVEEGSTFTVEAEIGNTIVYGTSFNIFARSGIYKVYCSSGKVWVATKDNQKGTYLNPEDLAVVTKTSFTKQNHVDAQKSLSWINKTFHFAQSSATAVFEAIERQYNVSINFPKISKPYSGHFAQPKDIETCLDLVCTTLNLKFKKVNERQYIVSLE